jgi:excisionase family DNA binding protein
MEQQRMNRREGRSAAETDSEGSIQLIDVAGLAAMLSVPERHVYRLVAERRIPYIKWGHLLRFDAAEVRRWLEANRVDPLGPRRQ